MERLLASLLAILVVATTLALPAPAMDERCDNNPDDPRCEIEEPTTPPPPPEPPSPEPPSEDPVAAISVIGCSNTNHAVAGYLDGSDEDQLINTAYAGHTMTYWATSENGWEEHYLPQRPESGYDAAWLNLCERAVNGLTQENVEAILTKIWEIDPGIPVWISPLNFYEAEDCVVTNGNEISIAGSDIADTLVAGNELLLRGPDLGPLSDGHLRRDACHPNGTGITYLGSQVISFFDN